MFNTVQQHLEITSPLNNKEITVQHIISHVTEMICSC